MTSIIDRPHSALLVIDMQIGVVAHGFDVPRVVGNIQTLVERARAERVPVIWVQHHDEELPQGSDAWRYVAELQRR